MAAGEAISAAAAQAEVEAEERRRQEALEKTLAEQAAKLEDVEQRLREDQARLELRRRLVEERERLATRQAEIAQQERQLVVRERELVELEQLPQAEIALPDGLEAETSPVADVSPLELQEGDLLLTEEPLPSPPLVQASLLPGTVLEVEMRETLSSRTSRAGDTFKTRVARDLYSEDGILAVPAGAEIIGRVTEAKPLRRVGGQASLGLEFTHLVLSSGGSIQIRASFAEQGRDQRRDKRKILAAAAAGAVLGRILGHKGSGATAVGAVLGAAAGTAVVARSEGKDVEIPAGQIIALRLEEVVTVTTEMTGLAER